MTQPLNYASPSTPKGLGRGFFGWLLFVGIAALLFVWLKQTNNAVSSVPFSTVYHEIGRGNVTRITLDGDEATGTFRAPVTVGSMSINAFRSNMPQGLSGSWEFIQWLTNAAGEVRVEGTNNLVVNILLPLVPWLLILAFIWFFVFRQLRNRVISPTRVIVVNPEEK